MDITPAGSSHQAIETTSTLVPFSIQQTALWKIGERADRPSRLVPVVFLLSGIVVIDCIQKCAAALVQRHASLRTRVVLADGEPMQRILAFGSDCVDCVELKDMSLESDSEQRARQYLLEHGRVHTLNEAPLFKTVLLKLDDTTSLLVFWLHHLIFDGRGLTILMQDFWIIYSSISTNSPRLVFDKEPKQYSDYVVWQEKTYRAQANGVRSYNKRRLAGTEPIDWPFSRGFAHDCETCVVVRALGDQLSAEVRAWNSGRSTYLFLKVLAAYASAISSMCKQYDFALATTYAGRGDKEWENTVGYFTSVLLLRLKLDHLSPFSEVLDQIGNEFLMAVKKLDYGETFMENLNLCGRALFQFSPYQMPTFPKVDLSINPFQFDVDLGLPDQLDLEVNAFELDGDLTLHATFRPEVLSKQSIEQLLESIEQVLRSAVINPARN